MVKENPDVFTAWFCNVDPRQGVNSPETDFAYYLRYYQERGAHGVGEITAPLAVDDPRMFALFRDCERCHLPVLMHFGAQGSAYGVWDDLHLPKLEKALRGVSPSHLHRSLAGLLERAERGRAGSGSNRKPNGPRAAGRRGGASHGTV